MSSAVLSYFVSWFNKDFNGVLGRQFLAYLSNACLYFF